MLLKKLVGIDISDTSIKIIETRAKNNGAVVLNYNQAKLKAGIIDNGEIKDSGALAKIITDLMETAKPGTIKSKDICLGIPDFQIFNYFGYLGTGEKKSKEDQIYELAYKNIPIEKNNLMLSYRSISTKDLVTKEIRSEVIMSATYNDLVTKWDDFFSSIGLNLVSIMSSTSAAFFGAEISDKSHPICMVDIGEKSSNLNIISKGAIVYSYTFNNAGALITDNISQLKLSSDGTSAEAIDAEKIKINFDTNNSSASEQSVGLLINNTLRSIYSNILSSLEICSNTKNICAYDIYYLGGSSKIKNLIDLANEFFSAPNINLKCKSAQAENIGPDQAKNEKVAENTPNDESIGENRPDKKISISLAKSPDLIKAGIDNIYLQSLGLTFAYYQKHDLIFTKNKIKNLIKANALELKKKKKEEELITKTNSSSWAKENRKLVFLISILLIGILLLPLAYLYRKNNAKKAGQDASQNVQFSVETKLELKIEISTNDLTYAPGMVKSRIIEVTVNESGKYESTVEKGAQLAKEMAKKHEKIWPETITETTNKDNLIFPIKLGFMAYNEADISAFVLKEGQERFGAKEFVLSQMKTSRTEKNTATNKTYFILDVVYLVNPGISDKKTSVSTSTNASLTQEPEKTETMSGDTQKIETATSTEVASPEKTDEFDVNYLAELFQKANKEKLDNYILVKETKVGYLNTRTGPGTNYPLLKRIYPGEIYELLDEENAWTKIKLSDTEDAWVSDAYIEKTKKQ